MPTGAGKTVVAGHIMQRIHDKGGRVLVLAHRRELLQQFYTTLQRAGLLEHVGTIQAGLTEVPFRRHQLAQVQTLVRRLDKTRISPTLIICDEAHHIAAASYKRILARFEGARLLGLTATPERLDGKGLDAHFDELICGLSIRELIERGRLAPYEGVGVPIMDAAAAGAKLQAGDYNPKDLDKIADGRAIASVSAAILEHARGRRVLAFSVNVRASKQLASKLQEAGIMARHIDAKSPPELRADVLRRFNNGSVEVLCNVDLFGEGLDAPACDTVVFARSTKSKTIYLQQAGRALRPQEGKTALFIDCCAVMAEHGEPAAVRHWSLAGRPGQRRRKSVQKVPRCAVCGMALSAPGAKCGHCGYLAAAKARGKPEVLTKLVKICGSDLEVQLASGGSYEIASLQKAIDSTWQAAGAKGVRELADKLGYSPTWADMHIAHKLPGFAAREYAVRQWREKAAEDRKWWRRRQ